MSVTASLLCQTVALLCFIGAAVGVPAGRFSLVAAGLAFLTLSFMVA